MNSRAKKVLLMGGALVTLMLLFPPWVYFDPDTSARYPAGYHFVLARPQPRPAKIFGPPRYPHTVHAKVNDFRLILQLGVTIPTAVGLAFLLRRKRSLITIILGILLLVFAALVTGFVIWIVVSERLEYGIWMFP